MWRHIALACLAHRVRHLDLVNALAKPCDLLPYFSSEIDNYQLSIVNYQLKKHLSVPISSICIIRVSISSHATACLVFLCDCPIKSIIISSGSFAFPLRSLRLKVFTVKSICIYPCTNPFGQRPSRISLSTIHCQLSTINYPLSTIHCQLFKAFVALSTKYTKDL